MASRTSRIEVLRGRPPGYTGTKGSTMAHCSSVRSLGYRWVRIPHLTGSDPPYRTDCKPFLPGPDMVRQSCGHRRSLLPPPGLAGAPARRPHRPAGGVAVHRERRHRLVYVPALREAYALRPLRALRRRSVALCRPGYDVLTPAPLGSSPSATRGGAAATRPFARVLWTAARHGPSGGTSRGPAGRPGRPARGGTASAPEAASSASEQAACSPPVTDSGTRPPSRWQAPSGSGTAFSARRLPATTDGASRLSGSKAAWSPWPPQNQSASSAGSQRLCFSWTKAHSSSGWTRAVAGGEARRLVVGPAGAVAGEPARPAGGALAEADQAGGRAGAAAAGDVRGGGEELVAGPAGAEPGRALALGEAGLTSPAVEEAVSLPGAVAHAGGEVALTAAAGAGAVGVEAAGAAEVAPRRAS